MVLFPRLVHLKKIQERVIHGKEIHVGVFCSGNGDRSPFAEEVLRREFEKQGVRARVFSFGISVDPAKVGTGASARTTAHAREMGYDLSQHRRRHIAQGEVQDDIKAADLLLGISPAHAAMAVEYGADESPAVLRHLLGKTWTLAGFAEKKEWTRGLRQLFGGISRQLALKDPYFHPKENEAAFRKDLQAVEKASKKAVQRLIGMRG